MYQIVSDDRLARGSSPHGDAGHDASSVLDRHTADAEISGERLRWVIKVIDAYVPSCFEQDRRRPSGVDSDHHRVRRPRRVRCVFRRRQRRCGVEGLLGRRDEQSVSGTDPQRVVRQRQRRLIGRSDDRLPAGGAGGRSSRPVLQATASVNSASIGGSQRDVSFRPAPNGRAQWDSPRTLRNRFAKTRANT